MMDIVEISKKRYTTKHYDATREVTTEELNQLLEVLRNAPSSVNAQPWHFIIVNNKTSKAKIMPAICDFNYARFEGSTYSIIFCIKTALTNEYLNQVLEKEKEDGRFPDVETERSQDAGRRHFVGLNNQSTEQLHAWESHQLYLAFGQLLFAAKAIGIDSTSIEGFDNQKLDEILNLKEQGLKSVVIATLGFASKNDPNAHRPKSRLAKEDLFTFI